MEGKDLPEKVVVGEIYIVFDRKAKEFVAAWTFGPKDIPDRPGGVCEHHSASAILREIADDPDFAAAQAAIAALYEVPQ